MAVAASGNPGQLAYPEIELALQRGDVVLLGRGKGGADHTIRAALIWNIAGDDVRYLLIEGVRSFERSQKHRSELDLTPADIEEMELPIARPVVYCGREYRLNPAKLPTHPSSKASVGVMARISRVVAREIEARRLEDRLTFRQGAMPIEVTA